MTPRLQKGKISSIEVAKEQKEMCHYCKVKLESDVDGQNMSFVEYEMDQETHQRQYIINEDAAKDAGNNAD